MFLSPMRSAAFAKRSVTNKITGSRQRLIAARADTVQPEALTADRVLFILMGSH